MRRSFTVPNRMMRWVSSEVERISRHSVENHREPLLIHSLPDGPDKMTVSVFGAGEFLLAAEQLIEAASAGEKVMITLPSKNNVSRFLGQSGKKLEVDVELYKVIPYRGGKFGTTFIHKMRTHDGDEIVWYSTSKRYDEGFYRLKATVHKDASKAHSVYGGEKQTTVTHSKLELRKKVVDVESLTETP